LVSYQSVEFTATWSQQPFFLNSYFLHFQTKNQDININMSGKVFVAGAGGYIGLDVALGFRRAGYEVYGLIRNEKNRRELEKNEIIVVMG
jgi:hypothetical protein